jgi:hypothetical protein
MTESEFVLWYVNKHYLFNGLTMRYKYQHDNHSINFNSFCDKVKKSISIDILDGESLNNYLLSWFKNKQIEAKSDILDYIKYKYKVTLGPTSWVISKLNGKIVNECDIITCFKQKYENEFIERIIIDWYENEMIRITETSTLHFK